MPTPVNHAGTLFRVTAIAAAIIALVAAAIGLRHFMLDDAFIGFRYVDNLLAGRGLVYNPPERLEGVTNLGWVLLLAPFAPLAPVSLVAKILGLALAIATAIMLQTATIKLCGQSRPALAALLAPLLLVANFDFVYFSLCGMETALCSSLIMAGLLCLLLEKRVGAALCCGLAYLVRPEALVIFPLYAALALGLKSASLKKLAVPAAVFIAIVAAISAFRLLYFGELWPNTALAKPSSLGLFVKSFYALLKGHNQNAAFPIAGLGAMVLVAVGALEAGKWRREAAAFAFAASVTGYLFAAYAPPDWTFAARYFAPYLAPALILFLLGAQKVFADALADRGRGRAAPSALALLAAAVIGVGALDFHLKLQPSALTAYPGYVLAGPNLIEPARWIGANLPPDATLATRRIGAVGYYSRLKIFDYKFGLVDREVAKLRRARRVDFGFPNHPALAELWQKAAPDYLLEDSPVIDRLIADSNGSAERFMVHGLAYRELKRFPLGKNIDWVLCERL